MAFLYREPWDRHPGEILRERLAKPGIIVAPGVFAPAVALLVEKMGFEAAYLSGAALTGLYAMPDLGIITLSELVDMTRRITSVARIPLIVDADTGFGEALNVVRTVKELEEAGAAAIQLEDQVLPKKCGHLSGKQLISPEEMAKKVRAAAGARRSALIVARTDARGVEGLEAAIERAQLYIEAGADIIFPEALESEEEFAEFARRVKAPLLANMTEFGRTPYIPAKRFEELGYKIVIFPVTLFRVAMGAAREALQVIREKGTQKELLNKMMTRAEFYELIGYHEYEKRDNEVAKWVEELIKRVGRTRTVS
ncbi:MAG: methylisocitrate lyase [Thermoproteota archaeon]